MTGVATSYVGGSHLNPNIAGNFCDRVWLGGGGGGGGEKEVSATPCLEGRVCGSVYS